MNVAVNVNVMWRKKSVYIQKSLYSYVHMRVYTYTVHMYDVQFILYIWNENINGNSFTPIND